MQITINNQRVSARDNETILDCASRNNISIPSLCHLEGLHSLGSCRICSVEVEGAKGLMAACMTKVAPDMVIRTNTPRVRRARKVLYELILSDHPQDCLACGRNQSCELQALGEILQAESDRFSGQRSRVLVDDSSPSIVRDTSKCVLCRRCVTMCNEVQGVGALNAQNRGFTTEIGPGSGLLLGTAVCTNCGQCTTICPTDALHEADATQTVWDALADPTKTVVVQTAPAVRAALGEEFGMPAGTLVTGKMASALRRLGFAQVFDTNFAADLTILEEGTELLQRIVAHFLKEEVITQQEAEALGMSGHLPDPVLPMITSCSPGWIKYIEHFYSDQLGHLSTCKSPHMMLGALAKTYYADKVGIDPKGVFVVSVMPCTAKKYEITRPEMEQDGLRDVDAVLTTRELGRMIREAGINFVELEDEPFDSPLGQSTGAADIFGTSGGVMEAALRTVHELVTGRELPFDKLHVEPIVGLERIKTADLQFSDVLEQWKFLEGFTAKIAVTHGLGGAAVLVDQIAQGTSEYLFIEVMGCPGGCISGGGQPRPTTQEVRQLRLEAIYREDEGKILRKSHENAAVQELYKEFLGVPCGHLSHDLLHTHYTVRNRI